MSSCSGGASSSSKSKPDSEKNLINGGIFKFHNKVCYCRVRAAIKISESKSNPNRLYYSCPNDPACGFFRWWTPSREEIAEFTRQMNPFEEQGIDTSDNNIMKLTMADLDQRTVTIEILLYQLKKYQFITMVILLFLTTIIYCKL